MTAPYSAPFYRYSPTCYTCAHWIVLNLFDAECSIHKDVSEAEHRKNEGLDNPAICCCEDWEDKYNKDGIQEYHVLPHNWKKSNKIHKED